MQVLLKYILATTYVMAYFLSPVICAERVVGSKGSVLIATPIAQFAAPWAISFLNDDSLLVTTRPGNLWLVNLNGQKKKVTDVPPVASGGQGGLGDVVLHPDYLQNGLIYLSYIEKADTGGKTGAVVIRAKLDLTNTPKLENIERIWTQLPKMRGQGHYSHRIAFGPKGSEQEGKIFITSGDRQYQTPAQLWDMALGKLIRLNDDGSLPTDNPFQDKGDLAKTYWSLGHRNALGLAFDQGGRLWSHEMGPKDGDEFNLIEKGQNYGWPIVSEGNHYNGTQIPAHFTRNEFTAPKISWVPTVAPSGLVIYKGKYFAEWEGNAFIGGLRSRALVRVEIYGDRASEVERFSWGQRIREVDEAPDGKLWVLEDGPKGRLIQLSEN